MAESCYLSFQFLPEFFSGKKFYAIGPWRILWIQQRYAAAASHSCVRSNSCIYWRISFKFCMEVYLGKIYTPILFGDAAPSVPSFIGWKVIFWWKSCVRSAGHISWWISFRFCTAVHHSQVYTPVVFGDAALSVPSFIGSKVIFWWKCVRSAGHISWRISFRFCTDVHHSQIYLPIVFGDAAPSVPSFIGSTVIFWFTFLYVL